MPIAFFFFLIFRLNRGTWSWSANYITITNTLLLLYMSRVYLLAVLLNAANLFFQVFFTILYSDLGEFIIRRLVQLAFSIVHVHILTVYLIESGKKKRKKPPLLLTNNFAGLKEVMPLLISNWTDYINPIDLCNKLNKVSATIRSVGCLVITCYCVDSNLWFYSILFLKPRFRVS